MKRLSFVVVLSWICYLAEPSSDATNAGSSDQAGPHLVDTTDALEHFMAIRYTNIFLFFCPEFRAEDVVDDGFRGCDRFMSRILDVVDSFRLHPVVNLRFGVGAASTTSPLAIDHRLDPQTPSVLYARKNQAGETFVAQFVGDTSDLDVDETFVAMWARDNSISFVRDLTDETFEHLTQASSGATTGDWLVAFVANAATWRRDAAARLALDTVCAEYKHQLSVAFVDVDANPKLAKRLKVTPPSSSSSSSSSKRLTLRYFRLEKMYYYEMDKLHFQTLRTFVTGGYRHAKAEKVPTEPTPFDQLVESVVARLKQLGYPSFIGTFILILAFTAAMSILIVLACCASKQGKDQDIKFKKG